MLANMQKQHTAREEAESEHVQLKELEGTQISELDELREKTAALSADIHRFKTEG